MPDENMLWYRSVTYHDKECQKLNIHWKANKENSRIVKKCPKVMKKYRNMLKSTNMLKNVKKMNIH